MEDEHYTRRIDKLKKTKKKKIKKIAILSYTCNKAAQILCVPIKLIYLNVNKNLSYSKKHANIDDYNSFTRMLLHLVNFNC